MGQIKNEILLRKIALQIKALRVERKLTQAAFFEDTSIHIARIETGRNNISVSTLNAICEYFEISLSDFFTNIK